MRAVRATAAFAPARRSFRRAACISAAPFLPFRSRLLYMCAKLSALALCVYRTVRASFKCAPLLVNACSGLRFRSGLRFCSRPRTPPVRISAALLSAAPACAALRPRRFCTRTTLILPRRPYFFRTACTACAAPSAPFDSAQKKTPFREFKKWRIGRDSNSREALDPYTLSRRAPSTARPPIRVQKTVYLIRFQNTRQI